MTNAVVLEHVSLSYPATHAKWAVRDVSLSIARGEFFCLVGPSGCGKSTILKLMAGLESPTAGSLTKPDRVGMVFQSGALLPWLTAAENVAFGLKMKDVPEHTIREAVAQYLKMVSLASFSHKYPRELSGGQKQRVGIARALAIEPEVLLLDEPFSALDSLTTEDLERDLLQIWQDTKITVVMVSHLLEEAVLLADRVGVMHDGTVKEVVAIDLPRPRNGKSDAFLSSITSVKALLA